jgi:hypothetical protein
MSARVQLLVCLRLRKAFGPHNAAHEPQNKYAQRECHQRDHNSNSRYGSGKRNEGQSKGLTIFMRWYGNGIPQTGQSGKCDLTTDVSVIT